MGSQTFLGLLLQINADPSQAQATIEQFEQATGRSFDKAAGATKPLNDSLLSNRESVRLLSEEMGVHLPRAVSSAIAEMLPAIGSLGTALLAVFAVEEVVKFSDAVGKAATEWGGYTKAVQEAEQEDIKASNAALIHFKTIAEGQKLLAQSEAEMSQLAQAGWTPVLKAMGEQGKLSWADLAGGAGQAYKMYQAYQLAQKAVVTNSNEEAKVRERLIAQLNHMTELQREENKTTTQTADTHGKLLEAFEQGAVRGNEAMWKAMVKQADDAAKKEGAILQDREKTREKMEHYRVQGDEAAARAINKHIEDIEKTNKAFEKLAMNFQVMTPLEVKALVQLVPAFKTAGAAQSEYMEITRMAHTVTTEFIGGVRTQIAAIREDYVGALEGVGSGLAALIGGQKAASVFKAGYEVAEGIACLASGTWPPNPAAIIAAGLHFEAAAQFAMMGGGGGGGSRSAGGSSGSQSRYGVGGGGGGSTGIGPAQPGGGHGPTIILNTYGPVVGSWADAGKAMANVLSQLAQTGQVKLVATTALTNGPKIT